MNSRLTSCSALLICIVLSVFVTEGWKTGVKCINKYPPGKEACSFNDCNFTNPSNEFYLGCEADCSHQHNSLLGYCGQDGYCYCDAPFLKTINTIGHTMCQNISHAEEYQTICMEDCQCNHNSVGGGCNFYFKACECGEINRGDYVCPYKTANEYYSELRAKHLRLGYPDIYNTSLAQIHPSQKLVSTL